MGPRFFFVLVSLVGCLAAAVAANQRTPPLVLDSMVGRDLYQFYCASCHGRDGTGSGPVAGALKTPPADLTTIARRHGGQFPTANVTAFVAEQAPSLTAHGSRDMPVWGPIFRGLDPSDTRAKIRIENLVAFIETIQVR